MSYEAKQVLAFVAALVGILAACMFGIAHVGRVSCEVGWRDSGMKSKTEFGVCLVEVEPGRWVPQQTVVMWREMP